MGSDSTWVRVSRSTRWELERFQAAIRAKTADETIRSLLAVRRKDLIAAIYRSARGTKSSGEVDRPESDH